MFCLMLDFERKNLSYLFLGFVFILTILFIGSKDDVITSYSIHYTKLYDPVF